jgi:hypothetical protein
MYMKIIVTGIVLTIISFHLAKAQEEQYVQATVAFWNLENLYDTLNDPLKDDDEFTREGVKKWDSDRYLKKLKNLSEIIEKLGDENGPEILGVCEIENRKVLEDLVSTPELINRRYKIVHFDSPDRRGVDVALIYKSNYFKPLNSLSVTVKEANDQDFITRDILVVTGVLSNDTVTFLVNHWPSRRGNGSEDKRILAAGVARKQVDSLVNLNKDAKIILMGDFNDDPNNNSIMEVLHGKPSKKITLRTDLYNPMFDMFKKGIGTLAYQDSWSLFDQMIMTQALTRNVNGKYFYKEESAGVSVQKSQIQQEGRFQGYPFRTYSGNEFTNGYSDHFPVFIYLIQKVKVN